MASAIDHGPQQPNPRPAKIADDGAKPPAAAAATEPTPDRPQPTTAGLVSLLPGPDNTVTSDASASDAGVGAEADSESTSSRVISPVTSPPYWLVNNSSSSANGNGGAGGFGSFGHGRTASAESVLPAGAITLQDNEDASSEAGTGGAANAYGRERNRACWAKSVEVVSHVVVNGSTTNIGAFVVWNIRVETLSGSFMNIRKRYSEFDDFRRRLVQTFPTFEAAVPVLPPKSVVSKFRPRFLEKRRAGLQYFLNCILLNPEFSGSPVLKEFLFS